MILERPPSEKRQKTVDVLFIVDATASMGPTIATVKDKIKDVARNVDQAEQYQLRAGVVAYRDFDVIGENGEPARTEKLPFTRDMSEFYRFLDRLQVTSRVRAGCTADDPEDVFSGIEEAQHMDWSSHKRVIIHLGDAPQHGTDFHDMSAKNDNFPNGDPEGRNLTNMLEALRKHYRVNLYMFIHLYSKPTTQKMVQQFKQNCKGSKWINECHVDQYSGNFSTSILDNVSSTIRSTITQSGLAK